MKKIELLFSFTLLFFACSSQGQSLSVQYEESLKVWQEMVEKKGNSYVYLLTYSGMAGITKTKVTIENSIVKKKVIYYFSHKKEVQSIKIYEGKEALQNSKTMDDIYEFTKNEVLSKKKKKKEYQIYVQLNEEKLLKKTGYYPVGCMDDCFVGFTIEEIKWGGGSEETNHSSVDAN